jgi:hypothetical protein
MTDQRLPKLVSTLIKIVINKEQHMKPVKWITTGMLILTCAMYGQGVPPPPMDEAPPMDEPGAHGHKFREKLRDVKRRVDEALSADSAEFKALLDKKDKTAEEKRELRKRRRTLIKNSEAVRKIKAEHRVFAQKFREQHGDRNRRKDAPTLTEKQQEKIEQHHETVREKHNRLNDLLIETNARYAELVEQEKKNPEEFREMMQLRRELLAETPAAEAILDEIRTLNETFHQANPRSKRPNHRGNDMRRARKQVHALNALRASIDEILAESSGDFRTLLKNRDATAEEQAQIAALRRELLTENEEAQTLQLGLDVLVKRLEAKGIDVQQMLRDKQRKRPNYKKKTKKRDRDQPPRRDDI